SGWQRDRDRLARLYRDQGFFEARIRVRRLPADRAEDPTPGESSMRTDDQIRLEYAITRGPTTHLVVRGATLPDAVRDRSVGRWTSALLDGFLERDARTIVQEHFYRQGHLHATVTATVALDASRDAKSLTIDVVPGPVLLSRIDVKGNSALSTEQVLNVVNA